jgi:HEAT repeat protein
MRSNHSLFAARYTPRAIPWALLFCLLACAGCGRKEKPTSELITDLKSGQGHDKLSAARTLAERDEDPAKIIPSLIEALKDKSINVRKSSIIALGAYGERAKEAIPALQARQKDSDIRIREAANVALSRIDLSRFSGTAKATPVPGK